MTRDTKDTKLVISAVVVVVAMFLGLLAVIAMQKPGEAKTRLWCSALQAASALPLLASTRSRSTAGFDLQMS